MKQRLNYITLLLSIIMLAAVSCTSPEQARLRDNVAETAKDCPIHVADGATIDTITYVDNVVTYLATVDSPMIPLAQLSQKIDVIKPMLIQSIQASDNPKVTEPVAMCKAAGASLRFILTDGTDTLTIDIPVDDL